MEVDFLDADTIVARSLDAADIVDEGCHLALVQSKNAVLYVERSHPGIGPHDADDGDIDFRKNVDGHAQGCANTHNTKQYHAGDDRIRAPEHERDQ